MHVRSLLMVSLTILMCFTDVLCASKNCHADDCIPYSECSGARELSLNAAGRRLIRQAYCGRTKGKEGKVCCQYLSEIALTVHPNSHLLPTNCGTITETNLLRGRISAERNELPWMALVTHQIDGKQDFSCAGVVINRRYVLTTASCATGEVLGVRIGAHDNTNPYTCITRNKCIEVQDIHLSVAIPHSKFIGENTMLNDIALLRLRKTIDFSIGNASPICLPLAARLRNRNFTEGIAAGWGDRNTDLRPRVLKKYKVSVYSQSECTSKHSRFAQGFFKAENKLCIEKNECPCKGDGGTPLMVPGVDDSGVSRYYVHGLSSYGPASDDDSAFPEVYTDVTKYIRWILDHIKP